MTPAIQPSSFVLIDPISVHFAPLKRNQVVILRNPWPGAGVIVKRVTAISGDCVTTDGLLLEIEKQSADECSTVPDGFYFVEGDNRDFSTDSRAYGPVPKTSVVARCLVAIEPGFRIQSLY